MELLGCISYGRSHRMDGWTSWAGHGIRTGEQPFIDTHKAPLRDKSELMSTREWAVIVPCYLMFLVLLTYWIYAGLTCYMTPPFKSMSLITGKCCCRGSCWQKQANITGQMPTQTFLDDDKVMRPITTSMRIAERYLRLWIYPLIWSTGSCIPPGVDYLHRPWVHERPHPFLRTATNVGTSPRLGENTPGRISVWRLSAFSHRTIKKSEFLTSI